MSVFTINRNGTQLSVRVDTVNAGLTYVGTAEQGTTTDQAKWSIQQITTSGGSVVVLNNAGGIFTAVWDNRGATVYN